MARKKKVDPNKKSEYVQLKVDPALKEQLDDYAEENKVSVSALLRSIIRWWTDPRDPRPLPPEIEEENKRPSRRRPSDDD